MISMRLLGPIASVCVLPDVLIEESFEKKEGDDREFRDIDD